MQNKQTGFILIIVVILLIVFLSVASAQHQTNINNSMTQTSDTSSGLAFETVQVQGSQTLTAQPTVVHQP